MKVTIGLEDEVLELSQDCPLHQLPDVLDLMKSSYYSDDEGYTYDYFSHEFQVSPTGTLIFHLIFRISGK